MDPHDTPSRHRGLDHNELSSSESQKPPLPQTPLRPIAHMPPQTFSPGVHMPRMSHSPAMVNTPSFGTPAIPSSHASRLPFLSSFWQNPEGVFFDTQEEDERILLFIRRHFITNFGWISGCMLAIVSPFLFLVGDAYLFRIVQLPLAYLIAIIAMYLIVVGTYAFVRFLEWYYNITLITNKRVLDVDFIDLIYKKISATKNTQIQDVTHEQSGTLPALFNYGNVLIQTAGTLENFHINTVPHPDMVVRIVDSVIGITDEGQTSISKEKEPDYG